MVNLVFFGGIALGIALLLLIAVGVWLLAGRSLAGGVLGLFAAGLVGIVVGPYAGIAIVGATFMTAAYEQEQRNRPPPPTPDTGVAYVRDPSVPEALSHNFRVEFSVLDKNGNRDQQVGYVTATLVYSPAARNGIDERAWVVEGEPMIFTLGSREIRTRWNAPELIGACVRWHSYANYTDLFNALVTVRGVCPNFDANRLIVTESGGKVPKGVRAASMMLTTTGGIAARGVPAPVAPPEPEESVAEAKPTPPTFVRR
jgi:hypothetical protein